MVGWAKDASTSDPKARAAGRAQRAREANKKKGRALRRLSKSITAATSAAVRVSIHKSSATGDERQRMDDTDEKGLLGGAELPLAPVEVQAAVRQQARAPGPEHIHLEPARGPATLHIGPFKVGRAIRKPMGVVTTGVPWAHASRILPLSPAP